MTKWIGAAALAATLMFGCSAIDSAAAAPLRAAVQNPQTSNTNAFSARRRLRHHPRYAQTYYLDRPYYYAPAPFVPFNFGYGLWPWW